MTNKSVSTEDNSLRKENSAPEEEEEKFIHSEEKENFNDEDANEFSEKKENKTQNAKVMLITKCPHIKRKHYAKVKHQESNFIEYVFKLL